MAEISTATTLEITVVAKDADGNEARRDTVLVRGEPLTYSVSFEASEPVPETKVLLGMCPTTSTSVAEMQAVFKRFPKTSVVRVFSDSGFTPWTSTILAAIPAGVHLVFSCKAKGLNWAKHFADMPERWNGLVDGIWAHEPEQQSGGDPLPADYRAEYKRIGESLAEHPRAKDFMFGPCFTEFRARADGETWWNNFGVVGTFDGVTRLGMDVYNTGYPAFANYRTPAHMWEIPFRYADRVGKPISIDEWGVARKNDPTGTICAPVIKAQFEAFKAHPRARTITWFNRGGCYLGSSPTDPAGRNPEYAAMADLIGAQ